MNGSIFPLSRKGTGALTCSGLAAAMLLTAAAGCGSKDNFARVNGQVISKDEYIQALERAPVTLGSSIPGAPPQQINAGRYVLDQMVGKKVVLAEASKMNVLPTDTDVNQFYEIRKKLFQQSTPTKTFEEAMKEQGTTEAEMKEEMRYQLAETALLAKRLDLKDEDIKKEYEKNKESLGLPERVQLRLILTPGGSDKFNQAKKLLAAKTDFEEIARQVNPPALKSNGGLLPQLTTVSDPSLPEAWRAKIKQTAEGASFGPVDGPSAPGQPTTKAWIKIEKRLPAYNISYEDAKPLIRQQMVQLRMQDPQNAGIRQEIMRQKLNADFRADEPKYQQVWAAVKEAAEAAGAGASGAAPAGAPAATAAPGG